MLELSWGGCRQCLLGLENLHHRHCHAHSQHSEKRTREKCRRVKKANSSGILQWGQAQCHRADCCIAKRFSGQKGRTELPASEETGKMWKMPNSELSESALRHRQVVTCLITEKLWLSAAYLFIPKWNTPYRFKDSSPESHAKKKKVMLIQSNLVRQ